MSLLAEVGPQNLTLGSVVLLFVVALLTGRLVPRKTLVDQRADYEQRIKDTLAQSDSRISEARADRDDWREAARLAAATADVALGQSDELLRGNRTTEHVIHAIGRVAGVEPDGS